MSADISGGGGGDGSGSDGSDGEACDPHPDKRKTAGLLVCDDRDNHVNIPESPQTSQITRRSAKLVKRAVWCLLSTERRRG